MSHSSFTPISQAVIDGNPDEVVRLISEAKQSNQDPHAIMDELMAGIRAVGDFFETGEFFLPDLMIGAKTMKVGLALIQPDLAKDAAGSDNKNRGKILIGTVKGDLHEIGKSLVALILEVNGYEVHDLGVDVSADRFITEADRLQVDVIALSSLLTTTAPYMREIINSLKEAGIRDRYRVIIGGAATSASFASQVGADGWSENPSDAIKLLDKLLANKPG
jgi:5-methyltetrahydrofolate--homocysteine methyltransferase